MRRLLLIRHAKSSWKFPELDDHERPLNKRGQRDVLTMARHLADKLEVIDVIYSSTATRALDYAQMISDFTNATLMPDLTFYTFSDVELLEILKNLPDDAHTVAVVSHNPAITRVVNRLIGEQLVKIPTSAIAAINCPTESWNDLESVVGACELSYLDYPKMFQ